MIRSLFPQQIACQEFCSARLAVSSTGRRISSDQFRRLQTASMDVSRNQAQDHTHLRDLLTASWSSPVSPVSGGFGKRGRFSNPPNTKRKGLGTSPHFSSETGQPHNPLASSSLPSTQTLYPQAMSITRVEDAANRVSTQSLNPKKQKLYSIIHSGHPVFTLYLWKSLSGSDLPELCKIGRWQ